MRFFILIFFMHSCSIPKPSTHLPKVTNLQSHKYERQIILDSLGVNEPHFDKVALTIRIYFRNWQFKNPNRKIIILDKLHDGEWIGRTYEYFAFGDTFNFNNKYFSTISVSNNWNKSWDQIMKNDLLYYPNDIISHKKFVEIAGVISDAEDYRFDILTPKKKGSFGIGAPHALFDAYDKKKLRISEVEKIRELINIIDEEFGLPLN